MKKAGVFIMKNRTLEELLKQNHYETIIDIIEGCENKRILEIRITKEDGFTKDNSIDKMIFDYLKKLKIKVVFLTDSEYHRSHNKFYVEKNKCANALHEIVLRSEPLEKMVVGQLSSLRFRIDDHSYISCPDCKDILKLTRGEGNGTKEENK